MRILHLAKYYWPRSGGMERVVQTLADGAANLGHQVEVVAVESRGWNPAPGRTRSAVTRAFSFAALGSQEIAPGYIAAAWKRADIIHLHHPHPLADLACLLRAGRTPVVVTQHADALRSIYRPMTRLVIRRARAVVVPSRAHLALSTELRGYESKVEVIPFGIDHTRWEVVPPPPPGQTATPSLLATEPGSMIGLPSGVKPLSHVTFVESFPVRSTAPLVRSRT